MPCMNCHWKKKKQWLLTFFDTWLKLHKHSWFTQNDIYDSGDYFETFLYEFGTGIPNFKKCLRRLVPILVSSLSFWRFHLWKYRTKKESKSKSSCFVQSEKYINAWLQITVFRHKRFLWQLLQRIIETWSASIIDNYKIKPVNPQEGSSDLFSRKMLRDLTNSHARFHSCAMRSRVIHALIWLPLTVACQLASIYPSWKGGKCYDASNLHVAVTGVHFKNVWQPENNALCPYFVILNYFLFNRT